MIELALTNNQIEDQAGLFHEQASAVSMLYETDERTVPRPQYTAAAFILGQGVEQASFDAPQHHTRLAELGGLRIIAGLLTKDQHPVYVPGIVLPDTTTGVRLGCLLGPDIIIPQDLNAAVDRPLSDMQQILLDDIAAKHLPYVGEHSVKGINAADIGHAALIAAMPPAAVGQLHNTVHTFVGGGLSQKLAGAGAMNIRTKHDIRSVRQRIVPAAAVARLIVARAHQMPGSSQFGATALVAGVTLGAVRSKGDMYPQPDIALNAMMLGRQT